MDIKYMDIKEFREKGYLQEINRRCLHPLGLALEIIQNDDGTESLGGIWDYREDKEGMYFDLKNSDESRLEAFRERELYISQEICKRMKDRMLLLGFGIEPVPGSLWENKKPSNIKDFFTKGKEKNNLEDLSMEDILKNSKLVNEDQTIVNEGNNG